MNPLVTSMAENPVTGSERLTLPVPERSLYSTTPPQLVSQRLHHGGEVADRHGLVLTSRHKRPPFRARLADADYLADERWCGRLDPYVEVAVVLNNRQSPAQRARVRRHALPRDALVGAWGGRDRDGDETPVCVLESDDKLGEVPELSYEVLAVASVAAGAPGKQSVAGDPPPAASRAARRFPADTGWLSDTAMCCLLDVLASRYARHGEGPDGERVAVNLHGEARAGGGNLSVDAVGVVDFP